MTHFSRSDIARYKESFTTAFPAHLSQNKLSKVLLETIGAEMCMFGTEYSEHSEIVAENGIDGARKRILVKANRRKRGKADQLV